MKLKCICFPYVRVKLHDWFCKQAKSNYPFITTVQVTKSYQCILPSRYPRDFQFHSLLTLYFRFIDTFLSPSTSAELRIRKRSPSESILFKLLSLFLVFGVCFAG